MTEWEIYWLLKLDDIRIVAIFITIAFNVAFIFSGIGWLVAFDEEARNLFGKAIKGLAAPSIVLIILATLTPTTKQMAAVLKQQLPNEILELLDLSIEKAKETLK